MLRYTTSQRTVPPARRRSTRCARTSPQSALDEHISSEETSRSHPTASLISSASDISCLTRTSQHGVVHHVKTSASQMNNGHGLHWDAWLVMRQAELRLHTHKTTLPRKPLAVAAADPEQQFSCRMQRREKLYSQQRRTTLRRMP